MTHINHGMAKLWLIKTMLNRCHTIAVAWINHDLVIRVAPLDLRRIEPGNGGGQVYKAKQWLATLKAKLVGINLGINSKQRPQMF